MGEVLDLKNLFSNIYSKDEVKINALMKEHINFEVGGPADILLIPSKVEQIIESIKICKENNIPYFVMGNGSNLLVKDGGIRGVVIKLTGLTNLEVKDEEIKADCGVMLKELSDKALENSLTGLEFACGIPGSVGGAVFMNAGAYNGEIKNVIKEAEVITSSGEIITLSKDELELGYRTSKVMKDNSIVINATFKLEKGNKEYISAKIDENAMNILLFTSGTTSKSKAVMLSQKNIASNVYAMQRVEDIRSTDSNLAFLPMHHIFGSTCLIMMLSCGVRNSFPDGLRYVSQNLKEYEVSVFVGVPLLVEAIYNRVVKEIEKQGKTKLIKNAIKISNFLLKFHIDIRRKLFKQIIDQLGGKMRFVISGGAPLDPKIQKGFIDLGIDMVQGYGLTETSPVIAAENMYKSKTGSIGVPMENVTVEIVNKDDNGIGELRAKGPNVMLGYYENEEETKNVLKDGWFYTGDLGYIDKEGFIFITGRQKNMIVLKNGKKIFPEEIETLVNRIDLVEECMVFGMPDEVDKNDVKLSVKVVYNKDEVKQKYGDISLDEIRDIIWNRIKNEVNTTVPRYKHIMNMILTDKELIKTTTKKVKRNEELKEILKK